MYPRELDDIFDIEETKMVAQLLSACEATARSSAPQSVGAHDGCEIKVIRVLSPKGTFVGTMLKYVFSDKRLKSAGRAEERKPNSRKV